MIYQRTLPLFIAFFVLMTSSMTLFQSTALAASLVPNSCTDAYGAMSGTSEGCGAADFGGTPVAFAKMQWETLGEVDALPQEITESLAEPSYEEQDVLAHRSGAILADSGVSKADMMASVQAFPTNIPIVMARYDPTEMYLQIDVYKVVKAQGKSYLMHSLFTPYQGDQWKAAGAYLSPDVRRAGLTPGVNPFESFKATGDNRFVNITFAGAQVAVGHAMRSLQAPFGVMAVAQQDFKTFKKKSGGAFRKKITVWVNGYGYNKWYVAAPVQFAGRTADAPMARFCATDPTKTTDCPMYEVATSGVTFEEFKGGTLNGSRELIGEVYRKSKSGFGFLAIIAFVFVTSFIFAAIGPAMPGLAGAGSGAATGMSGGVFGAISNTLGFSSFQTALGAAAFETAVFTGVSMLGGASFGDVYTGGTNFGLKADVMKGFDIADNRDMSKEQKKLTNMMRPRVTGEVTNGLAGFKSTFYGSCGPGTTQEACGTRSSGFIARQDLLIEHNSVQFFRDTGGTVVRDVRGYLVDDGSSQLKDLLEYEQ